MSAGEYVIGRGDPARIASAVVRYQLLTLRFWTPIVVAALVLAVLGGRQFGVTGAVAAIVLLAVLIAGTVVFKRRRLVPVLAARGYRPGTTLRADFDADGLSIAADNGTARHNYRDVADARLVSGIVVLRLRAARMLVALPRELVPDARLQALRAAP